MLDPSKKLAEILTEDLKKRQQGEKQERQKKAKNLAEQQDPAVIQQAAREIEQLEKDQRQDLDAIKNNTGEKKETKTKESGAQQDTNKLTPKKKGKKAKLWNRTKKASSKADPEATTEHEKLNQAGSDNKEQQNQSEKNLEAQQKADQEAKTEQEKLNQAGSDKTEQQNQREKKLKALQEADQERQKREEEDAIVAERKEPELNRLKGTEALKKAVEQEKKATAEKKDTKNVEALLTLFQANQKHLSNNCLFSVLLFFILRDESAKRNITDKFTHLLARSDLTDTTKINQFVANFTAEVEEILNPSRKRWGTSVASSIFRFFAPEPKSHGAALVDNVKEILPQLKNRSA